MTTTDESTAAALDLMNELREGYQARRPAELATLVSIANRMVGDEIDRPEVEHLYQRLHAMAGSAGTFGLAALGEQARGLEQQLKRWLAGSLADVAVASRQALAFDVATLADHLRPASPIAPAAAAPNAAGERHDPFHIWVVQADAAARGQLARQLESFGHSLEEFERLEDTNAVPCGAPDVLILEVAFATDGSGPRADLQGFTDRLAMQAPECAMILISESDAFTSRVWAARLGAEGYFLKPPNVPRLVSRIAQLTEQRRAPVRRVLIVDDDAFLAAHYRLVLREAGMDAEVLEDPRAIIEVIAATRPELVLLDLRMPTYSGVDLAGVIRQHERWSSLPLVYLSAETDLDEKVAALSRGADDFITKPISDAQLVAAVRARIDRARQLDAQISKDSLTGLLKHASIKDAIEIEVNRARRTHEPLTVAMLDIDEFKLVNDTYGHAAGDVVIAALATLLRQRLRRSDIIGRYGGEEFVVVLPECTGVGARVVLEDVRRRFASIQFRHGELLFSCTVSVGTASAVGNCTRVGAEILAAADAALYGAKRAGRNQVVAERSAA